MNRLFLPLIAMSAPEAYAEILELQKKYNQAAKATQLGLETSFKQEDTEKMLKFTYEGGFNNN